MGITIHWSAPNSRDWLWSRVLEANVTSRRRPRALGRCSASPRFGGLISFAVPVTIAAVPELPEVEYTRRQLQRSMAGARIARVVTRRPNLRYAFPRNFAGRLEGQRVDAVSRRAKYLLVALQSGNLLLMHLGMSGSFRVLETRPTSRKGPSDAAGRGDASHRRKGPSYEGDLETHDHVVFEMSNGRVVVFNDPRRFGFMTLLSPEEAARHATLSRLGPEPLARGFDTVSLARELGRRRTPLKIALSDQRVIAGLGNIYVSEALHLAGLSPRRRASTLMTSAGQPRPSLDALTGAIREVLKKAIRHQYRTGADDPFLVYDREDEACLRPGCTGTIRRIVQGGRSTFFCPTCQK